MLPLLGRVVQDLLENRQRLEKLLPEQDDLDRRRRGLNWTQRCRRYEVHEEVAATERRLEEALAELTDLGVVLLDPTLGCIGFPTQVNSRPAYFSWVPGEEGVQSWQYAGEAIRRPIPASWAKATGPLLAGKL
jgi:hypothetical protein